MLHKPYTIKETNTRSQPLESKIIQQEKLDCSMVAHIHDEMQLQVKEGLSFDSADAIAVALTHAQQIKMYKILG